MGNKKTQLFSNALVAAGPGTTNTVGFYVEVGDDILVYQNVTAVGPGTLDTKVQGSPDAGVTWYDLVALTQVAATGAKVTQVVGPIPALIRLSELVGGTSISATITVEACRRGVQ